MRIEGYVKKLLEVSGNEKANPEKIAYLVERTLEKVAETNSGAQAIKMVQDKIARRHLRQHFRQAA